MGYGVRSQQRAVLPKSFGSARCIFQTAIFVEGSRCYDPRSVYIVIFFLSDV